MNESAEFYDYWHIRTATNEMV